jgi:hypothetical protein
MSSLTCIQATVIIDWLMRPLGQNLPKVRHRHVEVLSQVTPGTGEWVLESKELQAWKDPLSSSSVLWMHGICNCNRLVKACFTVANERIPIQSGSREICPCVSDLCIKKWQPTETLKCWHPHLSAQMLTLYKLSYHTINRKRSQIKTQHSLHLLLLPGW